MEPSLRNPFQHVQAVLAALPFDTIVEHSCGCQSRGESGEMLRKCAIARNWRGPIGPLREHFAITVSPDLWLCPGREYRHVKLGPVQAVHDPDRDCWLFLTPGGTAYRIGPDATLHALDAPRLRISGRATDLIVD